jgi:hypothetical protein
VSCAARPLNAESFNVFKVLKPPPPQDFITFIQSQSLKQCNGFTIGNDDLIERV